MSELRPPPPGASVEVRHDGVVFRTARHGRGVIAAVVGAITALAAGAAQGIDPRLVAVGWAIAVGMVIAQGFRRSEVRSDDRQLVVDRRGLFGATVERVAMADVTSVKLGLAADDTPSWVEVRTREGRLVVGEGAPAEQILWLHDAVVAAAEGQERRARAEGREWSFLRTAPEALRKLRDGGPTSP